MKPDKSEVLKFIDAELKSAEQLVKVRTDAAKSWASGTDATWGAAGCTLTAEQRSAISDKEFRIAQKMMKRAALLKATLEILLNQTSIS